VKQPHEDAPNPYYSYGALEEEAAPEPVAKTKPAPKPAPPKPKPVVSEYKQKTYINVLNGRTQANPTDAYWAAKGIPNDPSGRMLAHYLDIDEYQEKMRLAKMNPTAKKKTTKKMIKAFKKKKEDKKRRRILMM